MSGLPPAPVKVALGSTSLKEWRQLMPSFNIMSLPVRWASSRARQSAAPGGDNAVAG